MARPNGRNNFLSFVNIYQIYIQVTRNFNQLVNYEYFSFGLNIMYTWMDIRMQHPPEEIQFAQNRDDNPLTFLGEVVWLLEKPIQRGSLPWKILKLLSRATDLDAWFKRNRG